MKAKSIAVLLSFCVLSHPLLAEPVAKNQASVAKAASATSKINLNKADVTGLTGSIKGIGKKRAEAIIAYRESHHGFKSIEELAEVKGLGSSFVERNRDQLKDVFVVN